MFFFFFFCGSVVIYVLYVCVCVLAGASVAVVLDCERHLGGAVPGGVARGVLPPQAVHEHSEVGTGPRGWDAPMWLKLQPPKNTGLSESDSVHSLFL